MSEPEVLQLYPFRFYDRVSRRWVRARYRATLEELQARYERFELIGEPELRPRGDPDKALY